MKSLIIFIPSIESGGVEKNLFILSNYLSNKIKKIYLVTANNNHNFKLNKKIKIICPKAKFWNNRSRLVKNFICFFFILNFFKNNHNILLSFQANLFAAIISKICNFKLLIRLNTSPNKYINNCYKRFIFRIIYKSANEIIVNSKKFKELLKKNLDLKANFIYNPMPKISKISKIKKTKKILKILNIGRLTDQKDQMTILKSMSLLKRDNILFKTNIIGSGNKYQELKNYIKNKNLKNEIKLLGYKKDAYRYMRYADLFILSSKYEGLPNVLMEAQQLNLPIISTNCPSGPSEILMNGKLGNLYPVGNYKRLYREVKSFYFNRKSLIKKTQLAKKYLKRFDIKNNCEKYFQLINKHI